MRIISWNVNGLRAVQNKGFLSWLKQSKADVVGLQETKISDHQIPKELNPPEDFSAYYAYAEKKGYSGTALYCKRKPDRYLASLEVADYDREGRFQQVDFGKLSILNVYFPNGKGSARDNSRVPFKMAFYDRVLQHLNALRSQGQEVVVMGDYNTAHQEIDLKNWKSNQKISGFLPEERKLFGDWLETGLIDTFRYMHGDKEAYSWWSPLANARERNVGWRIDYVLISKTLLPRLQDAFICSDVLGSDHCPVGIDLTDSLDTSL